MTAVVLRGTKRGHARAHLTRPGHQVTTRHQYLSPIRRRQVHAVQEEAVPFFHPADPPRRADIEPAGRGADGPPQSVQEERGATVSEVRRRVDGREQVRSLFRRCRRGGQVLLRPEVAAPYPAKDALPVPREGEPPQVSR